MLKQLLMKFGRAVWQDLTAKIGYSILWKDTVDLRSTDDTNRFLEYESAEALRLTLREHFRNFTCPRCGSRQVEGLGIRITCGKVRYHKEEMHKGWFGIKTYRDVCYKTKWRIHEIGLRPGIKGGLLQSKVEPGRLRCQAKGCSWSMTAPIYKKKMISRWYSVNDLVQSLPWNR